MKRPFRDSKNKFPTIQNSDLSNGETDSIYVNINRTYSNEYLNYAYENITKQNDESFSQNLNMILKELQTITNKIKNDEEDEEKSLDWKFAAMVIDRLCLVIFTFATFISTAVTVITSKNFFKFQ